MRIFTATRFHEPTKRGMIRPFLVEGEDSATGEKMTLVVKSCAGYEDQGEAKHMHIEAYCLLMAKRLGIDAAEPVAVDLPDGFEFGALDYRDHPGTDYHDLIIRSIGRNFATIHLGTDWKPWAAGNRPKKITQESINSAYAFDGIVQNDDRSKDNPNLLWKGDRLALLDFDRAWCLGDFPDESRPWRVALERLKLRQSCLVDYLQPVKSGGVLGARLNESLNDNDLEAISRECIDEVEVAFPGSNLDFQKIQPYVTKLAGEPDDFFQYLTQLVFP